LRLARTCGKSLQQVHTLGGRETNSTCGAVKPVIDQADDLLGEVCGLDDDVGGVHVKGYNSEYGRKGSDSGVS